MSFEIGSEFWDVPTTTQRNNVFPEFTQWFLSGRSALKSVIADIRGSHTVAMPSWCCDSMVKSFVDEGYEIRYYPVYWNKSLIQEISLECDVLFLIDYFGNSSYTRDLPNYKGVVIRDVTHSIFSKRYSDADYYFGSLRKWCGVWNGGYAWTKDGHVLPTGQDDDLGYTILREKAMQLKNSYIHGWGVTDKEYLNIFDSAEEILEKVGIEPSTDRDIFLAQRLDVDYIRERRRANAIVLMNAFSDWLIFPELNPTDCPMFVPILVPDGRRDELRRFLIRNEIYVPVHWPISEYHKLDERERIIYDNELSLICDQRYTEEDMKRIVALIRIFMEEG